MRLFNNLAENKMLPIFWKLLHDLLFLLLLFFAFSLVAEGLLPGIISAHFSLARTTILILLNIFLITLLGNFLQINSAPDAVNKKMILAISFLGALLLINGLLKIGFLINLFLTLLAIAVAYGVYAVILEKEAE